MGDELEFEQAHQYTDVIMAAIASQITSLTIIYSTVYSDADQRKHQSSASLAFVRGIHRWPVNSPHKWPVTRKMFPFDDVIMMTDAHTDTHNDRHRQRQYPQPKLAKGKNCHHNVDRFFSFQTAVNPWRAKFFRGNSNIYLHFMSFLQIDMTQEVEILPQIRQEPTYST